jgi:hypothetical protein
MSLAGIQAALEWDGVEADIAAKATEALCRWAAVSRDIHDVFAKCESPAERRLLMACFDADSGLSSYEASRGALWCTLHETNVGSFAEGKEPSLKIAAQVAKEQAASDKSRDRVIARASHRSILRFTGSEVWSDPVGVVREITTTLDEFQDRSGQLLWEKRHALDRATKRAFREGFSVGRRLQRTLLEK